MLCVVWNPIQPHMQLKKPSNLTNLSGKSPHRLHQRVNPFPDPVAAASSVACRTFCHICSLYCFVPVGLHRQQECVDSLTSEMMMMIALSSFLHTHWIKPRKDDCLSNVSVCKNAVHAQIRTPALPTQWACLSFLSGYSSWVPGRVTCPVCCPWSTPPCWPRCPHSFSLYVPLFFTPLPYSTSWIQFENISLNQNGTTRRVYSCDEAYMNASVGYV